MQSEGTICLCALTYEGTGCPEDLESSESECGWERAWLSQPDPEWT